MVGERVYRALLALYPRRFRHDYREPMLQLYRDARRDGSSSWARLTGDLFVSLPRQHKEAFRTMSTQAKLMMSALVIAAAVLVFLAIGGALFALALMLLLAWVLVRLLRERDARPTRGFWWKLTLSGVGLFALGVVIFAGPWPDSWRESVDGEIAWWSGAFLFAIAIVTIVSGLLSGVVEYASRRRLSH
jgi:hypothetical protein